MADPRPATTIVGMTISGTHDVSGRPGTPADRADRVGALPVLRETVAVSGAVACRLVLVAHALDTAVPFVQTLAGKLDLVRMVAVPYSARPTALARLGDVPITVPDTIDDVGRLAADAAVLAAMEQGGPVVLQEVGGYCAGLVDELAPHVRGIVENTNSWT